MKVLQINIFGNLSTGRIAVDLYRTLNEAGYEGMIAFARNKIAEGVPHIKIGNKLNVYVDGIMTRLTDRAGTFSKSATKKLINDIKEYNPDIIHLHNLHGYYINIDILFDYLKNCGKPVVWTLHDCWAYTGHCCYYSMVGCDKWKTGCYNCEQLKSYPASYVDNSEWNFKKKKDLFLGLPNLTLVTVSKWLANEVKQSFLKGVPLEVIYNGIDTSVFKPTDSNFRSKYKVENKFLILGVASTWDTRKGLSDFIELAGMLDEYYKIVLIGVTNKERKRLPDNVIGIPRTESIEELAGIYTAADVYFNASVEETFGLPTIEAMSCGTPVIVYNATSLPEVLDLNNGWVVEPHCLYDVMNIIEQIRGGLEKKEEIREHALKYEKSKQYNSYIELYKKIIGC